MYDEKFNAVVRDSDGYFYAGNGNFTKTVLEALRFFTIEDAQKAATSLNQQGFCDGSCRGKIIWVDYPFQIDPPTEVKTRPFTFSSPESPSTTASVNVVCTARAKCPFSVKTETTTAIYSDHYYSIVNNTSSFIDLDIVTSISDNIRHSTRDTRSVRIEAGKTVSNNLGLNILATYLPSDIGVASLTARTEILGDVSGTGSDTCQFQIQRNYITERVFAISHYHAYWEAPGTTWCQFPEECLRTGFFVYLQSILIQGPEAGGPAFIARINGAGSDRPFIEYDPVALSPFPIVADNYIASGWRVRRNADKTISLYTFLNGSLLMQDGDRFKITTSDDFSDENPSLNGRWEVTYNQDESSSISLKNVASSQWIEGFPFQLTNQYYNGERRKEAGILRHSNESNFRSTKWKAFVFPNPFS